MGNSPVGDMAIKNLTVRNTGHTNPLFITGVTSNAPEFAATGVTTCSTGRLAPLTSCTIAIGFTPSALGPHSATLQVFDDAASKPAERGGHWYRHGRYDGYARQLRIRQREGRLQGGQGHRRAQLSDRGADAPRRARRKS